MFFFNLLFSRRLLVTKRRPTVKKIKMNTFFSLSIFFLLSFLALECTCSYREPFLSCHGVHCYIAHVKSTKDLPDLFVLAAESEQKTEEPIPAPDTVTSLSIGNSDIHTLTSDVCKDFPNIEELKMDYVRMHEIDEDAFVHCKQLKKVHLGGNNIRKFPKNVFNNHPGFEKILLGVNTLNYLDKDLFMNLKNLTELSLQDTILFHIDTELFRNLASLTQLNLRHNKLFELDVQKILKYCPGLQEISLNDNIFECSDARKIIYTLKNNDVRVHNDLFKSWGNEYDEKIEGTRCLNEENYIKNLKSAMDTLRDATYNKRVEGLIQKKEYTDFLKKLTEQFLQTEEQKKNFV